MLQRDNIPAKPRRFSLIQHPITSDISLRRRYTSKYKLNTAIAEGKGLCVDLAPQETTHTTPTPLERTSYSPLPKSTSRICFKLTASCRHPRHICTHAAQHTNPLQTLPRISLSLVLQGLADSLSIPTSITQKPPPGPRSTSCSSDHYYLLSSRRQDVNTALKLDPLVPTVSSHVDRPLVMSAEKR